MRLTYVIPTLGIGGAERALILLAEEFASWGWKVDVITFSAASEDFYTLSQAVARHGLDTSRELGGNFVQRNKKRISLLKPLIASLKPDAVIAYMPMPSILTTLACRSLGVPVICMEQIDPRQSADNFAIKRLRRLVYPKAQAVVLPAEQVRPWAEAFLPKEMIHVIPNPVRTFAGNEPVRLPPPRKRLLAMGRMTSQKGFDLLLEAFSSLAPEFPDWTLTILGDGEDREKLEAQAKKLMLEDRIQMPGSVKEPEPILRGSDLYVLPSRFEGFPLALLEAMGCGLPCVAFDCPTGPGEIIDHGRTGLLVPSGDVDALAKALKSMMASPEKRAKLAAAAPEVYSDYNARSICERWKDLLEAKGLLND